MCTIGLGSILCLLSCSRNVDEETSGKLTVIFETDMGNDVDDAMALDMLYKYLDDDKLDVLGIVSNKDSRYSTEFIHLMNHWYGYPDIPIGRVIDGIDSEHDAKNYAAHVALQQNDTGGQLFQRPSFNHDEVPEAVSLYRQLLSSQEDSSVTIVSVGFSTNIVRLLQSPADEHSPLTGKELIAKKVKLLSIMAGSFGENKIAEYNVFKDIPAAQAIAGEWPTPIVFTPFEAGIAVPYPATSIENDFEWVNEHPVVEAYKYYLDMPYDRPTWDLIALLYVVENSSAYFNESMQGNVSVDDQGFTTFTPDPMGQHSYLELNSQQIVNVKNRFVELLSRKPIIHE